MTAAPPLPAAGTSRPAWTLAVASAALGGLLLLPAPQLTYPIGLAAAALAAASFIAVDDHRTGLIRNRWTAPFAAAALIQVLIASTQTRPWITALASCLLGATITTSLYLLLGLLGWVGFGDVKLAAGLALIAAITAGWAGLYLLPLALTFSALARLVTASTPQRRTHQAPHGPALVTALALLMAGSLLHSTLIH